MSLSSKRLYLLCRRPGSKIHIFIFKIFSMQLCSFLIWYGNILPFTLYISYICKWRNSNLSRLTLCTTILSYGAVGRTHWNIKEYTTKKCRGLRKACDRKQMEQLSPSHTDRSEKRVGYKSPFSTISPVRQVILVFVGGQVSEEWKEGGVSFKYFQEDRLSSFVG